MLHNDIFYNRQRPNAEEITSYQPKFYKKFIEMQANNKFAGYTLDRMAADMEQIIKNRFLASCDEETLLEYVEFINLTGYEGRDIEEIRNVISAYWIGNIKLSRTIIKSMVRTYCNCDSIVKFTNYLYIEALLADPSISIALGDLQDILARQIPAHISWEIATNINDSDVIITTSISHWIYPFELCGTNPDVAILGEAIEDEIIIEDDVKTYGYSYLSDSYTVTGTNPDVATAGGFVVDGVNIETTDSSNTYDLPSTGQENI